MGSVQPNSRETELDWQFSGAPSVDARIVFEWRGEQFVGTYHSSSPNGTTWYISFDYNDRQLKQYPVQCNAIKCWAYAPEFADN